MAIATGSRGGYMERPRPSGLADVLEIILDKGLVIDLYVRVSLIGIEILTIDARIVIASVDTYLRFAEAVGRMDIAHDDQSEGLPQLIGSMTSGGAKSKTQGAIEGVKEKVGGGGDDDDGEGKGALARAKDKLTGDDDDEDGGSEQSGSGAGSSSSRSRSSSGSRSRSRKSS